MEKELKKIDAYWRAANYLSVGQLYLLDNPLLKRKLTLKDIKPKVVGHWGTTPGQNFIYAHLNRVIKKYDLNMIYISGPGHGGNAVVANTYLEGTYSEIYKEITESNPMLPSDEKNEKFNDFLKQLLNKNPKKRLQSFENIRKSDFYKDYNFDKVMKKEIEPPFIPPKDSLMVKTDINLLNVSDLCSFEKFMKNNVFCSSNELDELIHKHQNEDLFDDF